MKLVKIILIITFLPLAIFIIPFLWIVYITLMIVGKAISGKHR